MVEINLFVSGIDTGRGLNALRAETGNGRRPGREKKKLTHRRLQVPLLSYFPSFGEWKNLE